MRLSNYVAMGADDTTYWAVLDSSGKVVDFGSTTGNPPNPPADTSLKLTTYSDYNVWARIVGLPPKAIPASAATSSSSTGLSTGAKVAIGVGIIAGAYLLFGKGR